MSINKVYPLSKHKLSGKTLTDELRYRKSMRELRRDNRIGLREFAKQNDISIEHVTAYENGYDVCPHQKYKYSLGGIPFKFIYKTCIKCGFLDMKTFKKIEEKDCKKAFRAWKRITKNVKNGGVQVSTRNK